jgi:hypothetical protein
MSLVNALSCTACMTYSLAAPVPRPPHPMNAMRIWSLPAAWADLAIDRPTDAVSTAPVFKKSRRDF